MPNNDALRLLETARSLFNVHFNNPAVQWSFNELCKIARMAIENGVSLPLHQRSDYHAINQFAADINERHFGVRDATTAAALTSIVTGLINNADGLVQSLREGLYQPASGKVMPRETMPEPLYATLLQSIQQADRAAEQAQDQSKAA